MIFQLNRVKRKDNKTLTQIYVKTYKLTNMDRRASYKRDHGNKEGEHDN